MADGMHLGDEVEILTDRFVPFGVPRGSIGVVVDDWADGSIDVQVPDPRTGEIVARIRAAENEIRLYTGTVALKEPRKHGILFGRGDELGEDVEEPPMPARLGALAITGYAPAPIAFSEPPREDVELTDDIPWELREEPPGGLLTPPTSTSP